METVSLCSIRPAKSHFCSGHAPWREGEAGMVKRRENGEIGVFSLCLPVDISSVAGRCQRCWSHAKAQRRKVWTKCSLSQHFILAPLREVKSSNRQTLESGQSGMLSDWLPVSLTPFRHPSLALPSLRRRHAQAVLTRSSDFANLSGTHGQST
jgi:hypothetical protein